jgi:hypothetical protein
MTLLRKTPSLSLETVIEELKTPLLLQGRWPEHAYLALSKHSQQVFLSVQDEDIERRLESLMSERWVPLGFVAYYADSAKPVTNSLNWYADLLRRDKTRYSRLCGVISARLEEAARLLTNELTDSRAIHRVQ